jgi:transposase
MCPIKALMADDQLEQLGKPELITLVRQLREHIGRLDSRIAELEAQVASLKKNSSNSSKPPSSDIVKPPPRGNGKGKRKIGGQPGHHKHQRAPFSPEQIDVAWDYTLDQCPDCGGALKNAQRSGRVVQQMELVDKPVRVEAHRALTYWCPHCQRHHEAPLPPEVVKAGLVGPRLTAHVAYLKGAAHASYATIQTYLRDVLKIELSTGQLARLISKVSAALAQPYGQLLEALPGQARANIDETGHKERGKHLWTWCFRSELFTMFRIDPSRGSDVLIKVLGKEFAGVIGADYFSAYRKYMGDFNVMVQFCLAHLIRDVKFLTTLSDRATRHYGQRLLEQLRKLFALIHRRDRMTRTQFERALQRTRRAIVKVARRPPSRSEAQNMAKRFRKHGEAYFRFITTPGIEPTNNLAERAIRFVVIDRKVTQGTRGETGRRWCERIWTTIATCKQQGRSVFAFLQHAVQAYFTCQPLPSLLNDSS